MPIETRGGLIERDHTRLPVVEQCELLGVSRSGLYYRPVGPDPYALELMRLLDEQYTRTPFYGVRRMTAWLCEQGHGVNPKRVRRLLREMGLWAIYPQPRLSMAGAGHRIYPYLLRGVEVTRPNQVWATDITYVRMRRGFVYLVAILDWYSRYVLAWKVSLTLELEFCLEALEEALQEECPEVFNSDQGVQFTSQAFTGRLKEAGIRISMDGRGRCMDNVFVERLWRSVKYEEVYLKDYETVPEAVQGLGAYFTFYNRERLHQSLRYRTPERVYREGL